MTYKRGNHTETAAGTVSKKRTVAALIIVFITVFAAAVFILVKGLPAKDSTPPEIHGALDLSVEKGCRVSYRNGVSVTDDKDEAPTLNVDASRVNLYTPGIYDVIYSARDSSGNESSVTIKLTVTEPVATGPEAVSVDDDIHPDTGEHYDPSSMLIPANLTLNYINELSDQVLSEITSPDMSMRNKASAIYNYVNSHIKYVGTSDKSSWLIGAYVGFTTGKGDCYNYYACSKALLTRAGIPNVDLERVGGTTSHFWNLVDLGEGYYHFDACPHPTGYPLKAFMITEAQAREYTERCKSVRKNYYVYDYESCPVEVVGTPDEQSGDPVAENPSDPAVTDPGTNNPTTEPGTDDSGGEESESGGYDPGEFNPYDPSTWN